MLSASDLTEGGASRAALAELPHRDPHPPRLVGEVLRDTGTGESNDADGHDSQHPVALHQRLVSDVLMNAHVLSHFLNRLYASWRSGHPTSHGGRCEGGNGAAAFTFGKG